jgi:hypothetical protein
VTLLGSVIRASMGAYSYTGGTNTVLAKTGYVVTAAVGSFGVSGVTEKLLDGHVLHCQGSNPGVN